MAETEVDRPSSGEATEDDYMAHVVCPCSVDIALCGLRAREDSPPAQPMEALPTECVVCADLVPHGCPRCGGWKGATP